MSNEMKRQTVEIALSWLRVFIAAILAQLAAGVTEWRVLVNAGFAALLPVLIRFFDKQDPVYGIGAKS